jgi:hypothetical protein
LWILGLIVVVAIAAVGLWFLFGDEGEPTATFDGQAATYSGPTSVAAGEITFTFDATEYDSPNGVMFLVAEVTDDSITLEEIEAVAAAQPASGPIPPFIGRFESQLVMGEVLVSFGVRAIAGYAPPRSSEIVLDREQNVGSRSSQPSGSTSCDGCMECGTGPVEQRGDQSMNSTLSSLAVSV